MWDILENNWWELFINLNVMEDQKYWGGEGQGTVLDDWNEKKHDSCQLGLDIGLGIVALKDIFL